MDRVYAIIMSFAAAVLALDQWTKNLTLKNFFEPGDTYSVWSWFNITLVHNTGVAFGMFRGLPDGLRIAFLLALPVVVLANLWYFMVRKLKSEDVLQSVAIGLVVGGAIGNVIDRIRFGFVIDMIDWHYPMLGNSCLPLFYPMSAGRCHWPVFNIADSAICIAIGLLVWDSFRKKGSTASA
jgi:signal peptidase II